MMRAIAAAVLSAGMLGQNPEPATLTGRIVDDATGEAIVNARVRATSADGSGSLAITDGAGGFSINAAAPASTLSVMKSGYVTRRLPATAGAAPIEIRLVHGALISGRVIDRTGEAVPNALVTAEAPPVAGTSTRTLARADADDQGEFRLGALPPGRVVVAVTTASVNPGAQTINGVTMYGSRPTKTYFPDAAAAADAEVITLSAGEEHDAVEFVVGTDQVGFGGVMFAGPAVQAARIAPASAAIRGRVSAVGGRALAGVNVRLLGSSPAPLRATRTDAQGRFAFDELPSGRFRIAAAKTGYVAARHEDVVLPNFPTYGAGPWIDVHAGETRDVDVGLERLGVVTGTIVDELGEPVQGASVQLLHVIFERGRRRLSGAGATRLTDDRGRYRIFDVPPGQYFVSASVGGVAAADLPGYARSYYPGSTDPRSAQFVSIGAAQDLPGIDFALEPVRTARIAGKILGPDGQSTAQGTLQLRPNTAAGELAAVAVGANTTRDGQFEFPNVPPGQYLIYADHGRSNPSSEGGFVVAPIAVNGTDVTDLAIPMAPGSIVAGRITFDTGDPEHVPPFSKLEISPVPVDPDLAPSSVANADIRADGRFQMEGITGLRRIEATRVPAGWMLRQVRVNGIDATDRPLAFGRREQSLSDVEVVITDRVNELAGAVVDDHGQAASGAHVVIFPIDRDRRYAGSRFLRDATAAADGAFTVAGLASGAYYAAVAPPPPLDGPDAWQDPAFLDALEADATTVTVGLAQRQTIKMKTAAR